MNAEKVTVRHWSLPRTILRISALCKQQAEDVMIHPLVTQLRFSAPFLLPALAEIASFAMLPGER